MQCANLSVSLDTISTKNRIIQVSLKRYHCSYVNSKHATQSIPIKLIIKASPPYSAILGGSNYDPNIDKHNIWAEFRFQRKFSAVSY